MTLEFYSLIIGMIMVWIKLRALCIPGNHFTTNLHPGPLKGLCPSSALPSVMPHLPKMTKLLQPLLGDQVFKHMNLWGDLIKDQSFSYEISVLWNLHVQLGERR